MVSWHTETVTSELPNPHYLLFCDTHMLRQSVSSEQRLAPEADDRADTTTMPRSGRVASRSGLGRWCFVLERLDGPERFEVADSESRVPSDRLALLAVVRGLEALEQPSRVSLVTTSRYVSRGLKYGLETWRQADYQWERFGVRKPIRNADLWRRVDRALQFHGVNCKLIQPKFESPSAAAVELDSQPRPVEATPPPTVQLAATAASRPSRASCRPQASVGLNMPPPPHQPRGVTPAVRQAPPVTLPADAPSAAACSWRQRAARGAAWLREKLDVRPAAGSSLLQRTYAGTCPSPGRRPISRQAQACG